MWGKREKMPQASDKDREEYRKKFGDIGCEHGIKYLRERGWILNKDWTWKSPCNLFPPNKEELFILGFLVDEWDFGWYS